MYSLKLWWPVLFYWLAILILFLTIIILFLRHEYIIKTVQRASDPIDDDSGGDGVSDMELPAGNSRDRISGNAGALSPDDVGDIRDRVCGRRSVGS